MAVPLIFGAIARGVLGGLGSKKAAKQSRSDIQAAAGRLDPFAQSGQAAQGFLNEALGLAPSQAGQFGAGEAFQRFQEQSGLRPQLERGFGAVTSNLAASGLLGSSGAADAFARTQGELQGQSFQNFLNALFGQQQAGQTAATNQASLLAGQPTTKGSILTSLFGGG
jgi:hypothetical protein